MKILKYIFISIISCIGLSACVDDVIKENDSREPWHQGDVPYYITLKLNPSSDSFSRAGEENSVFENFKPGVHANEHAISPNAHNFAVFFDENDAFISCADLYSVNETAAWEDANTTQHLPATESTYKCRFYGFANSKPAKVLVVVNAPQKVYDKFTDFPGWNVEEVMKNQVWEEPGVLNPNSDGTFTGKNGKVHSNDPRDNLGFYSEGSVSSNTLYFTMTNSTYLSQEGDGFKLNCAQEFPEGSVTTDPSKIGTLTPVTVYLERMVSKFQLTTAFDPQRYIPTNAQALDVCKYVNGELTYSAYNWGIQLLGWGVNGLETSSYLFKNLPYKGDELTESLRTLYTTGGWNSAYNRRNFWSLDPHYYKDPTKRVVYPWQYDDARDKYDSSHQAYYSNFQSYDDRNTNFALAYYPFQSFCQKSDGSGSFVNDEGVVDANFSYGGNSQTLFSPENTFVPGLTVDRSRGSRAYELAGTHLLLCSRLLLPNGQGEYQPFSGNVYRNRVGVTYVDEVSMFLDFMNAVNYKLNSQKHLYYKYYDWDNDNTNNKDNYRGHTISARSEGDYALYCYFPYFTKNTIIDDLVKAAFANNNLNWENGVIIELTHDLIDRLNEDKTHYQLYKDADAINADGKVIPWIMYRDNSEAAFTPLRLMILEKQPGDVKDERYKDFLRNYDYGDGPDSQAEFILGSPDDKRNFYSVGSYLSGTQGSKVGLATFRTSVTFDNFKVTSSDGELFSDDFSDSNTLTANWKIAYTGEYGITGDWRVIDGQLIQHNIDMRGEVLYVNSKTFPRSYTIEVEATPNDGYEGFFVVFNYGNEQNYCYWNVGSWDNKQHELEIFKNGKKEYFVDTPGKLIYGQTYRVQVRVNGNNVKCYLDGEKIHDVNLPLGREIQYDAIEIPSGDSGRYIGNDNDVQSIFYEIWGVADCFKNGLMYYAVPIYAQDKNGRPIIDHDADLETNANEDFIDDDKLRYYYGVVRNNWYKFSLNSINGIGIAVSDPTKPIVPNYDGELDQNKVEMELIPWHMEDQTVTIPFTSND